MKRIVCILTLLLNISILQGWVFAQVQSGEITETDLIEPELSAKELSEKEMFDKGVILLKQEKYPEAVQAFTALIEISPGAADAYKNRGVAYMKQNLYDEAIRDFEKTIDIQPDLKGLYSNLGVAWYYQKEYRKAIENYDKEIEQSPNSYFTYFNRAICWSELQEKEKSLKDINKTLEIMPELYPALCLKGDLLAEMNQPSQAKEVYEKAISLNPAQTYAKNKLAELKFDSTLENIVSHENGQAKVQKKKEQGRAEPEKTAEDPGLPTEKVYELQVGAFRVLENAKDMQKKLAQSGVKTRLMIVTPEGGKPWHFVRTGNYPSYGEARAAEGRFEEKTGMDVMVKLSTRW